LAHFLNARRENSNSAEKYKSWQANEDTMAVHAKMAVKTAPIPKKEQYRCEG